MYMNQIFNMYVNQAYFQHVTYYVSKTFSKRNPPQPDPQLHHVVEDSP